MVFPNSINQNQSNISKTQGQFKLQHNCRTIGEFLLFIWNGTEECREGRRREDGRKLQERGGQKRKRQKMRGEERRGKLGGEGLVQKVWP